MSKKRLVLPEHFLLDTVELLRDQMVEALSDAEEIELDAACVGAIDYGSVQLLLAFKQALDLTSVDLQWSQPSSFLKEKLTQLHIASVLGIEG